MNSTLSWQDDKAVIKCLCMIIRVHMIKSVERDVDSDPEFQIFRDTNVTIDSDTMYPYAQIPSLDIIMEYFNFIFKKSMMESECIIMTLIYLERLLVATNGRFHLYASLFLFIHHHLRCLRQAG